ncbi:DUF3501 family protein [Marinobacter sediminum]|uniref:DUF3501 family protein n=1 Tax=Marinobacter sediminum TaxID=256323 RepID=UPI00202FFD65|nr:DUF3501 family protein [Marinobacter sediminum]
MTQITRDSLLTLEAYARQRPQLRAEAMALKKKRSVFIGPNVTLQFENEATIRYQIQEMLRIEKTFEEEGIEEELEAYNPLIPDGDNFKATMMIEFTDPAERNIKLTELRKIENHTYIQVSGHDRCYAFADEDMDRANDSKTSAVHFLRFQLTPDMVQSAKQGVPLAIGIDHPGYNHRIDEISPDAQGSLLQDLK